MSVILIPYWVKESLNRRGLAISETINLEKLKEILSFDDLAMFVALNNCFDRIVGFSDEGQSLIYRWTDRVSTNQNELIDYAYNKLLPIANDESTKNKLESRLFDSNNKSKHYEKPFIVCEITPDIAGVVIYPGYFDKVSDKELQEKVVDKILRILYVYCAPHDVANTMFFKRYLELLSSK